MVAATNPELMDVAEALGLQHETAVDDEALAEQDREKARQAMGRQRAWLGREMFTWLLWKSNTGDPIMTYEGEEVLIMLTGAVVLQGVAEDTTELKAKGHQAAYAEVVRQAMLRGLLVHQARFRWVVGDIETSRIFEVTIDAEHFGLRQVRLPKVLSDEPEEALMERLFLLDQLSEMFELLWEQFAEVRASPSWVSEVVPAIRTWMEEV